MPQSFRDNSAKHGHLLWQDTMKWSKAEQEQPELSCALPPWAIGHGMLSNDLNVDGGTETADNVTGHA